MDETATMPLLFVGHGSPMNAIEENEFSRGWREAGVTLPRPKAVLCVSAHWETRGTRVTGMARPRTIHDFSGFPRALYEVEYPAPGSPETATEAAGAITHSAVALDTEWGLDHGCWSVLRHLLPGADVPVVQLSLDRFKTPREHYAFARELSGLRKKRVLIIGSGNIVHNLSLIDWENPHSGYDWARAANERVKNLIESGDHQRIADYPALGREVAMGVPTPEHYLPLLYALAGAEPADPITFFNDRTVFGSISMTSIRVG